MAPPNNTSFNGSTVAESSISDSIVDIGDDEIKGGIIEALKGKKDQNQGELDKLNSALNQKKTIMI